MTHVRIEFWVKHPHSGEEILTTLDVSSVEPLTQHQLVRIRDATMSNIDDVVYSRIVPLPAAPPEPFTGGLYDHRSPSN